MAPNVPFETTLIIRDKCLCLHLQRAARVLARYFDEALRSVDLTNEQFSVLMSLNRPESPTLGSVAALLGTDRTTLTAALKPLRRRRLVNIVTKPADKRRRHLSLTHEGDKVLARAVPLWRDAHRKAEAILGHTQVDRLRGSLGTLATLGDDTVQDGKSKSRKKAGAFS